jgi:hypothetical protein
VWRNPATGAESRRFRGSEPGTGPSTEGWSEWYSLPDSRSTRKRREIVNCCKTFPSFAGLVLAVAASHANAQQPTPSIAPKWGTTGFTIQTVGSFAFQPLDPAAVYANDNGMDRWIVSGTSSCWAASVSLSAGALLDHIELDGCANSASDSLSAQLNLCSIRSTCPSTYLVFTTGAPGCGRFPSPSGPPLVVDNLNVHYVISACTPGSGSTTLSAVRVYYRLEVSTPTGSPTFLDVPPGSPYYQFVEALFHSGITAGCGGGNFCPDSPVTRGQMAVFLATALGLYWAN